MSAFHSVGTSMTPVMSLKSRRPVRSTHHHRAEAFGFGSAKVTLSPLLMTTAEMRALAQAVQSSEDTNPEPVYAAPASRDLIVITENPLRKRGHRFGLGAAQASAGTLSESKDLEGLPRPTFSAGQLAMYSASAHKFGATTSSGGATKFKPRRSSVRTAPGKHRGRAVKERDEDPRLPDEAAERTHFGPAKVIVRRDTDIHHHAVV